jgi:2-polyprenyl-3-methyl-5-hydroxy-6-metoxy-1,4-benzoquinol methylase
MTIAVQEKPVAAASVNDAGAPKCRFCATPLVHTFCDLGTSPLCQRHVTPARFNHAESFYPLHVYVCDQCHLVQLPEYCAREEIFDAEYGYFSSFSDTMLKHASDYVNMMMPRFGLGSKSKVVELASNDGYLLQYFVKAGVPVLGIDPTANTAAAAEKKGVRTLVKFFGIETAKALVSDGGKANLILGNNVLAHVPDINDFVGGMKILLAPGGVVTMEFPQLLHLIEQNYWDTIYHEHFSYLSFTTVEKIFAAHGMTLFDVDEIATHGGSIRIYAKHADDAAKPIHARVAAMKDKETKAGHFDLKYYTSFGERVKESKRALLEFLIIAKRAGKSVAGYGAPGKGNTLLNYCGIRTDFMNYTVDRSPHKQGNFLPGTRIPIYGPEKIKETKPDYLLILPWNLKDEIMKQMAHIRDWGGQFVVPIPAVKVY